MGQDRDHDEVTTVNDDTAAETPTWCGWWRPHRRARWRLLTVAGDRDGAMNELLDRRLPGGDIIVLPRGQEGRLPH